MPKIALARCDCYERSAVESAVRKSLSELGGIARYVRPGQKVLVKPNLLAAEPPERGVVTHPEVVRAVLKELLAIGAKPLVGDSPGLGSLARVAQKTGLTQVCLELGVPLGVFTREIEVKAPHGMILKTFPLVEEVTQVDAVINLPRVKTHGLTRLTGAVKNLFGCVAGLRKGELHFRLQHADVFHDMLIDLALTIKPVLNIVDGIMAMEGAGPRNGSLRFMGLIIAGTDPFAVDATIARLVGLEPAAVPLLALAAQRGLSGLKDNEVEILGEALAEFIIPDFKVPPASIRIGFRVPRVVNSFFRRYVSPFPVVKNSCRKCGVCLEACPARLITFGRDKVVIDDRRCLRCYCCHEFCPHNAIELKTPFLGRFL